MPTTITPTTWNDMERKTPTLLTKIWIDRQSSVKNQPINLKVDNFHVLTKVPPKNYIKINGNLNTTINKKGFTVQLHIYTTKGNDENDTTFYNFFYLEMSIGWHTKSQNIPDQ